jgi:hypothetical protein
VGILTVRCRVSQEPITCITDFEGATLRVICAAFEEADGMCRLKRRVHENGPLSQLLDRVSRHTLDARGTRCDFA